MVGGFFTAEPLGKPRSSAGQQYVEGGRREDVNQVAFSPEFLNQNSTAAVALRDSQLFPQMMASTAQA